MKHKANFQRILSRPCRKVAASMPYPKGKDFFDLTKEEIDLIFPASGWMPDAKMTPEDIKKELAMWKTLNNQ